MNLINAKKNETYIIIDILKCSDEIQSRFNQLGFNLGSKIVLKRKAPFFGDPLLFEVGESQIALTKNEASLIKIDLIQG